MGSTDKSSQRDSYRDRDTEEICIDAEHLMQSGNQDEQRFALRLLRVAARRGSAWAQYSLGYEYERGKLVPKNTTKAREWYQLAADQSYPSAQVNLGRLIANKRGAGHEDCMLAASLYRKAAKKGNRNAYYNLGRIYELGKGVRKNLQKSFRWYLKAAKDGDIDAQCHVGYCYFIGEGVAPDPEEAVVWYKRAAAANYEPACYNLSLCYKHGHGVKRNRSLAERWLRKAAELGHEVAKHELQSR